MTPPSHHGAPTDARPGALRLAPGEQWIRLTLVTPAHFGASEAEAAVENPVHKNALTGLPTLPDSTLRGVWGATLADDERRHRLGTGDAAAADADTDDTDDTDDTEPIAWGRPGDVVFGDGELLAFPVPTENGGRAWVLPAGTVWRILDPTLAARSDGTTLVDLLETVADQDAEHTVVAWGPLPVSPAPDTPFEGLRPLKRARGAATLHGLLQLLLGPAVPRDDLWLLAGPETAVGLWRAAAERRAQTALEAGTKTVQPGTLRTAELVPAGTVLVSRVSYLGPAEPGAHLPARLQAGAWESLGMGWLELSALPARALVEKPPNGRDATDREATDHDAPTASDPLDTLATLHQRVEALAATGDAALLRKTRGAVGSFGSRVQTSGLAATLAFGLVKAKPWKTKKPGLEQRAWRWLLNAVLDLAVPKDDHQTPTLLQTWAANQPWIDLTDDDRIRVLARWSWLRRFAELGLEPPKTAENDGPSDPEASSPVNTSPASTPRQDEHP